MKEIIITNLEAGQRLNKYLNRLLPNAGQSFLYKMLRKKNITCNGKKAEGSEILKEGDVIRIFFSDETFASFSGGKQKLPRFSERSLQPKDVIYEDPQVLVVYKPAGLLSQKDTADGESMNERVLQYLADSGFLTEQSLRTFKPGVCNRIDRNTAGLLLCAKTLQAGQQMAELLRNRNLHKYYYCVVLGEMKAPLDHTAYLTKDEKTNQVRISKMPVSEESRLIHTGLIPVRTSASCTLLRIELFTGRSHQIRAVLASLSHPIIGDPKYQAAAKEEQVKMRELKERYALTGQALLAYSYHFPKEVPEALKGLAGKVIDSPVPRPMERLIVSEFAKGEEDIHAILEF